MRWLSFSILLMPIWCLAQESVTAQRITDPFDENYDPEVSVSGNVIVGVMNVAAAEALADNAIRVRKSKSDLNSTLCLRVVSMDGIYTSRNMYRLPVDETRPIRLPYESERAKEIDQLAVTATIGDCDEASSKYYLPTGSDSDAQSEVVIYLNSFGATDVFYEMNEDSPKPCEYISEGRRTAFDFECRISQERASTGGKVKIIRERFGREQPSVELNILAPLDE